MTKLPKHVIILYMIAIALAIQFYYLFISESLKEKKYSSSYKTPTVSYTATPSPSQSSGGGNTESLSLDDIITGVLILEEDPYQPVSEKQARELVKPVREIRKEREEASRLLDGIDRVFTKEQNAYRKSAKATNNMGYIRESSEKTIEKMLRMLERN
jgi:hypothetical protein